MSKAQLVPDPPSPGHSSYLTGDDGYDASETVALTGGYTRQEERVLTRKLDLHILPIIFLLYAVAFLDRSNIGNAYTAGMKTELRISSSQYQWLLTIYYITYLVLDTRSSYAVLSPKVLGTTMPLAWGLTSMLQAAAFNWQGLMVARFFLGVFEASFIPGIALFLSYFYPRYQYGLRFGIYVSAAALASSFAGALAYGIVHALHLTVLLRRLLFIVEGLPTVLLVPVVYLLLPNSIKGCGFLTPRERDLAQLRLRSSNSTEGDKQRKDEGGSGGIEWSQVLLSLCDPINYLSAAIFFIMNVTYGSLPVYLPTILNDAGFSSINAQGRCLSAPPYLAAWMSAIGFMFLSDRLRHRGLFVSFFSAMGGTGYVVLATCRGPWVRYGAIFLVAVSSHPQHKRTISNGYLSWLSNNQVKESQRGAGLALFGVIGQCGPILGVRLYPASEKPYYVRGSVSL
ncbi:hypothetical protein BS47DRAFT_1297248 [Hydnum rufescens UP504]|uniref:MFS general substrate transporter n=1 Tax=Hydnum rufescens UP504 TaxID=1448309 RepID=A0A9P6DS22_9AGAM|nr:hypothetical protein BS47DRAFT_1297248 [Hydnum rufescens UP504]